MRYWAIAHIWDMKFIFAIALLLPQIALCQAEKVRISYSDATIGIGSNQGALSLSYGYDWRLGKRQKFGLGVGGRFTTYLGQNQYYETAPAKLTSGSTSPGVIFENTITANIDTLLIASPQVNMFNVFINLSYAVGKKFLVGFNIDAIGFSFGGPRSANYINGSTGSITSANPSPFNLLLVSDNDLGSLNSELYLKYQWTDRWSFKGGIQFVFTEYTSVTQVQQYPEPNDRFRNKSLLGALGVSYRLN